MFNIKKLVYAIGNEIREIEVDNLEVSFIIYAKKIDDCGEGGYLVVNRDGFRKTVVYNPIEVHFDESLYYMNDER